LDPNQIMHAKKGTILVAYYAVREILVKSFVEQFRPIAGVNV